MSFVIRPVHKDGRQAATERHISSETLTIGRGADRDLLLNSPRVALHHASLRISSLGNCVLECDSSAGTVVLNKAPVRGGRLNDGDEIVIGGRRLRYRNLEGKHYLEVDESPPNRSAETSELRARSRMRLTDTGVSKRRWSWGLSLSVLILCLLLPLGVRMSPTLYSQWQAHGATPDTAWLSGPYSAAHRAAGLKCDTCHLELFEAVPDRACGACHAQVQHHTSDMSLLTGSGIDTYRCANCHLEHAGDAGLTLEHPRLCTDCHADPAVNMPGSTLAAAADFHSKHPEFLVPVWSSVGGLRMEQRQALKRVQAGGDDAGFIFPHDIHLDAAGINDAQGQKQQLQCASCHVKPDREGDFAAINFERHCQDCHRLDFDPASPQQQLKHGDLNTVLQELRGHFAVQTLQGAQTVRLAPAAPARGRTLSANDLQNAQRRNLQMQAQAQSDRAIEESLRIRLCTTCHTVTPPADATADWTVQAFHQRRVWMAGAQFEHAAHKTESCISCHAAEQSKTADDVLLPDLARCRDCHGGPQSPLPLLQSVCVDCHGFHNAKNRPMLDTVGTWRYSQPPANDVDTEISDPP